MPPRSAKRKPSARSNKSTPKSKQSNVESTPIAEENNAVSVLENKDHELVEATVKVEEKLVEVSDVNSVAIDGSNSVLEDKIAEELTVKKELVAEVENIDMQVVDDVNVISEASDVNSVAIEGSISVIEDSVAAELNVKKELVVEVENTDIQVVDDVNSVSIDCSTSVIEDTVAVELNVKKELVAEVENRVIQTVDDVNVIADCGLENGSVHEKNDDLNNTGDLVQKAENADEGEKGAGMEQNEGGLVWSDGPESEPVAEINSAEEETAAIQANDTKSPCENNTALLVKEDSNGEGEGKELGDDEESNKDDNEDIEDDEDPSLFVHDPVTNKKKDKNLEIYIGRLDKGTVEDDLIEVFGKFGELKTVRIVRNQTTKKSKGFAFIRFANVDQAKNALSELKYGIEVRGKQVKISASQDNDTLYMGNICKTWRKEDVLQTLKQYGIDHIEDIHVPDDPKNDKKIKGFALLEFSTHSDAMAAFKRLRKPDAVFGLDKSAKVAFTQTSMHTSEEVLSQVKRVYLEGLSKVWNQEKVKEICKQYGEVVKINLCQSPSSKHKDFGFITFTSRESALACVQGINDAHIGEGEVKVKASIAKPQYKGRLQKQGFRGGFKVAKQSQAPPLKMEGERAKEDESSKVKGDSNSEPAKRKRKASSGQSKTALSEPKTVRQGIPKKSQSDVEGQNVGTTSKLETTNRKRKKPSKVESRGDGGIRQTQSKSPSKKLKGNMGGRQRDDSRKPKKDPRIRKGRDDAGKSTKYRAPYAPGYAASRAYHPAHAHTTSIFVSERHNTDMEPHAGYIQPVSGKQGRPYSGYVEPVVRTQVVPHVVYLEPAAGNQRQVHSRYVDRTVVTHSHSRNAERAVGTQVQPFGGYVQPAFVPLRHDPYNPGLRRAGGHDGRGNNGPAYAGVGPAPPAAYIPNYTSYAGYQGGGSYYQSSGVYPPPRTYY